MFASPRERFALVCHPFRPLPTVIRPVVYSPRWPPAKPHSLRHNAHQLQRARFNARSDQEKADPRKEHAPASYQRLAANGRHATYVTRQDEWPKPLRSAMHPDHRVRLF